ncbi:hypothetical protein BH23ACT10_BH23ACT10_39070 [soil metagenome]
MTALTTETQPHTAFELTGTAYRVENDSKYYKQDALRVRAVVTIDGEEMFADIRIVPSPNGFWNSFEKDTVDPAAKKQRAAEEKLAEGAPSIDVDQQTVRQLKATAANLCGELPKNAKRAELVATLTTAITAQQAEAA